MPDQEAVLTLDDLRRWPLRTPSLAVVGHPIAHSVSPPMHLAALRHLALTHPTFGDWRYYRFDLPPEQLAEALPLFHQAHFHGINLTLPHKVEVLPLLQEVERTAGLMGAVNTLLRTAEGYKGFNTDGYGMAQALLCDLGLTIKNRPVVLLGAGGAARSAAIECLLAPCSCLWIGNRNPQRLAALLEQLLPHATTGQLQTFDLAAPPDTLPREGLLINATSLGLKAEDPAPLCLDHFAPTLHLLDMVYNPPETALLRAAKARRMPATNGLSMLVWQGAQALRLWSGHTPNAEIMRQAAAAALQRPPRHV